MKQSRIVDLQQLLELEGESIGNLSQHLALLGIRWSAQIYQRPGSSDPADRELVVHAWSAPYVPGLFGEGRLSGDLSGDWTLEEALLSVLECALRQLWAIDDIVWPDDDDVPF